MKPAKNPAPKKRGRPSGSKNKNRKPSLRRQPHSNSVELTGVNPIAAAEMNSLEKSQEPSVTSSSSIDDQVERFETVAAGVPDVIGGSQANAISPDVIDAAIDAQAPEGMFQIDHATVRFYLKFSFEQIARLQKDERWYLDNEELNAATPVTVPVAQKWLGWLLAGSEYKEEIAFCLVMFGIVGPRLTMPKKPTSTDGMGIPASSVSQGTEKVI